MSLNCSLASPNMENNMYLALLIMTIAVVVAVLPNLFMGKVGAVLDALMVFGLLVVIWLLYNFPECSTAGV